LLPSNTVKTQESSGKCDI